MQLYSTRTQEKEQVHLDRQIGIYCCGITPYDTTHLGHAFTFLHVDVLARLLRRLGAKVTYVQNLTDVDDDLLKKARELGTGYKELAFSQTERFLADLHAINISEPDRYVQATDHIPEMVALIRSLLDAGLAYKSGPNVYFSVEKDSAFGSISNLSQEKWLETANERGNVPGDKNKKNPLDFVLWQESKEGEPKWDAPFGLGRPGWHTECVAMSTKYLGQPFTIHAGGADLAFPHHEMESAQGSLKGELAKIWMHTGMLRYQGEKMSKSLGNLVLVRNLLETYSANAIRIALLCHRYRDDWEFREEQMERAALLEKKLVLAMRATGSGEIMGAGKWKEKFYAAMEDDLNTPLALEAMESLAGEMTSQNHTLSGAKETLHEMMQVLGIRLRYEVETMQEITLDGKKLMVIGAHPDDNDFMAAGAAAIAKKSGKGAVYVIATRGDRGSNDSSLTPAQLQQTRRDEQLEAARILGVGTVEFLDHPDGNLVPDITLKEELVRLVRKHRPDIIITMDPTFVYDTTRNMINHADHRAIGEAAMDVVYPLARDLLSFPEHGKEGLEPHIVSEICFSAMNKARANSVVDVSDVMEQKLEALLAHKSQLPSTEKFREMVKGWHAQMGLAAGVKFAEGFVRISLRGHWEK